MNLYPVIMAGGAGTRLWPLSREEKPKQFHNLSGQGSLLEGTIKRLEGLDPEDCLIVTSHRYRDLSTEELKRCGISGSVLCEPRPRNTAAAVLYGALFIEKRNPEGVMIVLPADHHILDEEAFRGILKRAVAEAKKENLVTIGIKPTYPETGYGYIKAEDGSSGAVLPVDQFVEKPDLTTAESYLASGRYFWNSGIIAFKVNTIIDAFKKYLPEMIQAFSSFQNLSPEELLKDDAETWKLKENIFNEVESVSIDKGILEAADNRVVIPAEFGWADLGSWKATDDILSADTEGNRSPSPENAIFVNSENCSVFSEGSKVAVVGLDNVIVVQAGDKILVINKDNAQDVRQVVDIIKGK